MSQTLAEPGCIQAKCCIACVQQQLGHVRQETVGGGGGGAGREKQKEHLRSMRAIALPSFASMAKACQRYEVLTGSTDNPRVMYRKLRSQRC